MSTALAEEQAAALRAAYERGLEEAMAAPVRYYGDQGVSTIPALIKRTMRKLPLDLYIEDKLILQLNVWNSSICRR